MPMVNLLIFGCGCPWMYSLLVYGMPLAIR